MIDIKRAQHVELSLADIFVGEYNKQVDFEVKRFYFIKNKGIDTSIHGNHALRNTIQAFVLISGTAEIHCIDNMRNSFRYTLKKFEEIVVVPKMIWRTVTLSPNSVIISLASKVYDPNEYIKDEADFFLKQI